MSYPTLFTTPGVRAFAEAVDAERQRQLAKWGEQHHPDGTGGSGALYVADRYRTVVDHALDTGTATWRDIVLEEVYEALAETDPTRLRTELVQVAAVCAAWIADLDGRAPGTMQTEPVAADEGDELVCVDMCGSCDACGMEPFGTPAEGWREAARFLRRTARASSDRQGALHGARLIEAELRRVAGGAPATETQPESCANCGKPIRRVTGTLAAWWVHDPGGNTVCDWARPASSPRATPKPATEAEPLCCPLCADKPLLRTPTEAHDHFRTVHPEQQLAGPGPWPLLVPPPSCPGYETVPNWCPCPCEGCKHHCGAHQPAAAARQDGADRPGLRERYRAAWAALTPEQQATRLAEFDQDAERQDGAQPS